ncbi:MDR family MFS transporter [Brevibacillus sp. GCM10020057]|uniref:MDR family MFS transporter n=1 Tax=Brevibacillus sp. GCM10020057 TaxID=3317327 RepID=UPI0036415DC4
MNHLRQYWQSYHPIVHLLLAGTMFVMLTQMMSMPFLAIYLSETTTLGHAAIGVIVGAGPLAGTVGGFFGGVLSDLFGRRNLLFLSMLVMGACFVIFVLVSHPLALLAISLVKGLAGSVFGTVSKAMMGDLTPEEKRFRVFSNRYLAINFGVAIGPVLGAFLGIAGSRTAFLLTGGSYVLFVAVLAAACYKYMAGDDRSQPGAEKPNLRQMWEVLRRDTALLSFVVGGIMLVTVHGQMSVPLSQYLREHVADGVALFGVMMSTNGFIVLLMQIPLTRLAERYSLFARIAAGALLMAAGEIGFALMTGWSWLVAAMIVFTMGEILIIPAEYAQIDQISPAHMRGTYYGAQSVSELGSFLGPWMGGMLLSAYGGTVMFLVMATIAIGSLVFYGAGQVIVRKRSMYTVYK